jgi:glucokinase
MGVTESTKRLALGIDLGGTKILTAIVSVQGETLSRDYRATPVQEGPGGVVKAIVDSANVVLRQAGIAITDIEAAGIGAPGISNPDTGTIITSPNLPGWCNVPLRDMVADKLDIKCFLVNDANAAALGELSFGAGRGARNFIYVTLSTGIGGGIVVDGRVYSGATGFAGEIGHMTIDDDGPLCNCGNKGCWEALASGRALEREARRCIERGEDTTMLACTGGELDKVTALVIQAAAEQGDKLAQRLIARTGRYVGVGLANLINIFNPELIVIGGGLSNMGNILLKPALKEASERAYKASWQAVRFARAELGADSGVLGAAIFAFREES